MDGVALVLNNRREIKTVTVEGHTCNCPSWGMSNQELSEARAKAVRDYLVNEANVDGDRLKALGRGGNNGIVGGKLNGLDKWRIVRSASRGWHTRHRGLFKLMGKFERFKVNEILRDRLD